MLEMFANCVTDMADREAFGVMSVGLNVLLMHLPWSSWGTCQFHMLAQYSSFHILALV
jgi:hypothetical protein